MAELIKVNINEQEFEVEKGARLIDVCHEKGFRHSFILLLQRSRFAGVVAGCVWFALKKCRNFRLPARLPARTE